MNCRVAGCAGSYSERHTTLIQRHQGNPVLVERVPVFRCDRCGDEYLHLTTLQAMEQLVAHPPAPVGTAPIYRFDDGASSNITTANMDRLAVEFGDR